MSYLTFLGHLTANELPQFSLYLVLAFLLGTSISVGLMTVTSTSDEDEEK